VVLVVGDRGGGGWVGGGGSIFWEGGVLLAMSTIFSSNRWCLREPSVGWKLSPWNPPPLPHLSLSNPFKIRLIWAYRVVSTATFTMSRPLNTVIKISLSL